MKKTALIVVMVLLAAVSAFAQSEDDFEVEQLANNTLRITKYKGTVTDVVIPGTLYGLKVTIIGNRGFYNTAITSVVIPDTVTEIEGGAVDAWGSHDSGAFEKAQLTSVSLGSGLVKIGAYAFMENKTLESIVIPNSVTEIGSYAFRECGLTSVTLGNRVQNIGFDAFRENKITELTLPASLRKIDGQAFYKNNLTSLIIPNGVNLINKHAFRDNPITTLVIPPSLAKSIWSYGEGGTQGIGSWVFTGCPLTRITLPANMDEKNFVGEFGREPSGFEENFVNFWKSQKKAAGTYVKRGPIWSKE
jgi:hypothetical protein